MVSQQRGDAEQMLVEFWACFVDGGETFAQH